MHVIKLLDPRFVLSFIYLFFKKEFYIINFRQIALLRFVRTDCINPGDSIII